MDDDAFRNDPAFKHLFSHRQMIELVIRRHFPEWHGTIDYSTLERRPTELIDDKKLLKRYSDTIWHARTTDGTTDLLLLLEFQGKPERHMVLRTTAYNALAVQELIKDDEKLRRGERQLAVASLVLHHGDRKWKAPTHLDELFRGTALYTHRVADRLPSDDSPRKLLDLPQLVLDIAALKKPADVARWVAELGRLVADCDNEDFNRFMARGVRAVLRSKKVDHYGLEEAETMEAVEKWYGSGFDEVRAGSA